MDRASVALLMGSDSDWEVMRHCAARLDELGIATEVRVMSAHRTPTDVVRFAEAAGERGLQVQRRMLHARLWTIGGHLSRARRDQSFCRWTRGAWSFGT